MGIKLKELKNIISENCVTIILNTHRTSPDNNKDSLTLKNLIKEAEARLFASEDKREAKLLVERLKDLASEKTNFYKTKCLAHKNRLNYVSYTTLTQPNYVMVKTLSRLKKNTQLTRQQKKFIRQLF